MENLSPSIKLDLEKGEKCVKGIIKAWKSLSLEWETTENLKEQAQALEEIQKQVWAEAGVGPESAVVDIVAAVTSAIEASTSTADVDAQWPTPTMQIDN